MNLHATEKRFSASLFLRLAPAQPKAAIQTARTFVGYLKFHKWEQAYRLTTQADGVGKSLGEFQDIARRQWPGGATAAVQYLSVSPFQSYGNRLRRWLHGREVENSILHIEFSIDGVPFEVRATPAARGGWKVCYFQSHAG